MEKRMAQKIILIFTIMITRVICNNLTDYNEYYINNDRVIYNSTDNDREKNNMTFEVEIFNNETDMVVNNKTACDLANSTDIDVQNDTEMVYKDIHYAMSIIEEPVSIEKLETNGVNLYDVVNGSCGSAVVCPKESNWTSDNSITIGFLGAYIRSQTVLGALPLAVAAVNREPSLLPGMRLRFVAADIGGARPPLPIDKDSRSLRVMTQMRDLGVVAFFGPDGTCHTEAKLAAAWNLPLISHKCAGARGSRDASGLGATFARTLPPAYKVSKSVVSLLSAFKWTKFAIVAGDETTQAQQQMDAIKELAQVNNMMITADHRFTDYLPRKISEMERIVDQTYDKTRVYVFLGEHIALVDFVSVLQRRGLLKDGQYAVVAVDDEIYDPSAPDITHNDHLGQNSTSDILAFRAVLKLTPSFPINPHYTTLCQMIRELSAAPPFCVPNYHKILFEDTSVPIEAAHLYDAVILWARAATAALKAGRPATDGASLMRLLRPTTYRSVQGFDVNMDSAGDAEGNFTVIGLVSDPSAPGGWRAQPVATFRYANRSTLLPELVGGNNIAWIGGKPPVAEPACGFDGVKCSLPHDPGVISAVAAVAAAAILAAALLLRHYRYEQKLASVLWRIEAKDLTFIGSYNGQTGGHKTSIPQDVEPRRAHTTIALYRGNIVAIKRLQKKSIDVTRAIRKELKQIRELRHENLVAFVGVCVESGSACIASAYCSRGSLANVLADRDLHLDDMFVASLVADLLKGLTYLHDSPLISHGNLTSSNCLVNSRWVLQIADYGLHNLKSGCADQEDALRQETRMLWRAPEFLRDPNPPPRGSQKGDVYSFGIILYEILGRNGPWGDTNLTDAEIIGRVRQPIGGVLFRPPLAGLAARPAVIAVLNACWSERPDRRPDLRLVRLRLKDMHAGMKTNIFDNMLAMMEKYASNLETLVAARTEQLLQEKRRTDDLLNRMLPRTVAEALKRGERVQAESFDCVTIYFSDIVGFTGLAATNTPMQVVEILNDLYTCCDAIISYYNVYKVAQFSIPNLMAILSGKVPNNCLYNVTCEYKIDRSSEETTPLLIEYYKKAGYMTAIGNDNTKGTRRFYNLFDSQKVENATDHIFKLPVMFRNGFVDNQHCFGRKSSGQLMLDFASQFMDNYKEYNFFGFFYSSVYSSYLLNMPELFQDILILFLVKMQSLMHNTFIFLFGGGGLKFGLPEYHYFDDKLPMFFLHVPYNFRKLYPALYKNLKINQRRLTNHFDLHALVRKILEMSSRLWTHPMSTDCKDCVDLFSEVPANRKCSGRNKTDFCAC